MTEANTASPQKNTPNPARALLQTLQAEFAVLREHQPLAIGIDKQILAARPDTDRKLLRIALGMHTKSLRYLKTLKQASQRFNLDGSPASEVSSEQQAMAAEEHAKREQKRAEVHKAARLAREKAEKEAVAERRKQEKLGQLLDKFSRH
ncbi:MAG: osmoprotectant transporter activator [Candidatus Dactylopiibacterium carminicum]|uniref:Osmoprotectant transporter activator n=1 Tax=Candidatus Dactylopiibacterium carminicum TaxID=857335 RepID=A0A272EQ61_9RHOO|nr:ProQ/FinO family protein [Candidatus Dactylopiibacterium carminicum]KAF7598518.1 osmoprotectant transporter activator [Candidatus Dactylopiibacterium carminicum]PAS92249.1 MAG: osmoprotectant transporter activator [Candidatus Dactylopiibacterium carminicum]PAS95765.1 MAG: osmoprotectant transporter activator [Candidatus Dactylopiibacterium carminicum]PAS98005.1 MAG: hypothetical protein BSR46_12870 [Candidatus Dactylopiibacterium carminicum]